MFIKMSTAVSCELGRDEVKKIVKQAYPGNQSALMVVEIKDWASYGLKPLRVKNYVTLSAPVFATANAAYYQSGILRA